jgi:hypothetical protein
MYLIGDKSYYIQLADGAVKPLIRSVEGQKQLVAAIGNKLSYSLLF